MAPGEGEKRPKKDAGNDTRADARMVNAMETDPEFFRDQLIGQTLGKCSIEKYIGEGKTSVVYRATYEPLSRTVAVKVLQAHLKKVPAIVRVFQHEGRAVAALDHENVLKIYGVGEDQGHHYLVLELLHGKDLLVVIDAGEDGHLPVEQALDLTRQAAAGLAAAHRKNLVHRDIKPQNLVVEPDGTLKIVDFGLAAEAEGAFAGGRLGTPHYMSPEVCRGEQAGTASDIYSLGITLFHMLVGHPPYAGRQTTEEIVEEHLKGKRLEPEKLRRDLSPAVADLVRRMTRLDPSARPRAKEIIDYLAKAGSEKMRRARPARSGRVRRAARKKQSSPTVLIIGGVVVLGGLALMLMMGGSDDPPPQKPNKPVVQQPVTKKPVAKKPRTKIERSKQQELDDLLKDARQEEKTKNLREALVLYQRVMQKAPVDSRQYAEAKAAAGALRIVINAERAGKSPRRRGYISPRQSEAAGRDFIEKEQEFQGRILAFEVAGVRTDMEALLKRTREGSPERLVIETALRRVGYVERTLQMAEARAETLTGSKAQWSSYDLMASGDLLVMGANAQGIEIKDEASGDTRTMTWPSVDSAVLISFLDAVRNERSAEESLWLGYLCTLVADDRGERYYEFAMVLDASAEMRNEIAALSAAIKGK